MTSRVASGAPPLSRRLLAPAKVNLGLRVVGRRADGYHELESLFVPLDLADELVLEVEAASRAHVELVLEAGDAPGAVPADASNLAARAARAFLDAARHPAHVRVRLRKRVPAAAGLGGGSSDAAAVLRALDALLPGAVSPGALAGLALRLGADVPFFLSPRPAWVRGIGERIEPVAGVPALDLVLANPGVAVPTARVYAGWDAADPHPAAPARGEARRRLDAWLASGDAARLAELVRNDLEAPARALCPAIGGLRAVLEAAGALAVGMSGSGASVYGVFPGGEEARRAAGSLVAPRGGSPAISTGCAGGDAWVRVARTAASG